MPEAADVLIVGIGMTTAVGLSAAETAASVRSATMRFTESTWHDHRFEPFTLAEVIEDGLPELNADIGKELRLTYREARLLRLGTPALLECLRPLADSGLRPGLCLALPDFETTLPLDRAGFLRRLAAQSGAGFDVALSQSLHQGRAGGLLAIRDAAAIIRSGGAGFMIAGGIDSFKDLYVLGTLDKDKRVKSSTTLDGFIPGEGAGFLLLASPAAARSPGLKPLAALAPVAAGVEPGHLYSSEPYRGEGLAMTIQEFLAEHPPSRPIAEVYSSMNGESHWAKEWGVAFLRNRSAFEPEHGMHHPADCYGDCGAACGPLMAGLAAMGMAQGYRKSPALVYCSSDRGERALTLVMRPEGI